MLRGGDELGHTQCGNNNAYCQDNELNWINWDLTDKQRELLEFAQTMVRLRHQQPVLRRRRHFQGRQIRGSDATDIVWLTPHSREMRDADWHAQQTHVFGVQLNGRMVDEVDEFGRSIVGNTLLVLFNSGSDEVRFSLPQVKHAEYWRQLFDTAHSRLTVRRWPGGGSYTLQARSTAVFSLAVVWPKFLTRFLGPS